MEGWMMDEWKAGKGWNGRNGWKDDFVPNPSAFQSLLFILEGEEGTRGKEGWMNGKKVSLVPDSSVFQVATMEGRE